MSNILKPKRGKRSTAIGENIKLENGEIFFEMPEAGVGKGAGNIKFGDGTTLYRELPYFFNKDAFAPIIHSHEMRDVSGLTDALTIIDEKIEDITEGTIPIGKAEDSNRLGGLPAGDYATITGNQDLINKTYNGYTLADAAAKSVDEDILIEESSNLPTSKAVSDYVILKMGEIVQIRYVVVNELPETGERGVIYLVPHEHGINDTKDEYIWTDESVFEKIGNTDIDLSGYALVNHNHSYNDLLDLPDAPPVADNETIIEKDGKLIGSRIRVLEADPINPTVGDMWVLTL